MKNLCAMCYPLYQWMLASIDITWLYAIDGETSVCYLDGNTTEMVPLSHVCWVQLSNFALIFFIRFFRRQMWACLAMSHKQTHTWLARCTRRVHSCIAEKQTNFDWTFTEALLLNLTQNYSHPFQLIAWKLLQKHPDSEKMGAPDQSS